MGRITNRRQGRKVRGFANTFGPGCSRSKGCPQGNIRYLRHYNMGERFKLTNMDLYQFVFLNHSISLKDLWTELASWQLELKPRGLSQDGGGDGDQMSRILEPRAPLRQLQLLAAIEVFSVLICHEKCMTLKIHGLLQFSFRFTSEFNDGGINLFKKDKEDPLSLFGRGNTIPVLNGSRLCEAFDDYFSVICDLKDTLGNLSIKGHQSCKCDQHSRDRQLCSIFRGDHGFAALHYTIFSSAVQVNLKVFYKLKALDCVSFPTVFGSFCAQYNDFDYSSNYKKNCYRIVLFKRIRKDSVQVDADGLIPLSRSSFVVPSYSSYSSFMFDVDLVIGTQEFSGKRNFEIGTSFMSIKNEECEVHFELEWSEVK